MQAPLRALSWIAPIALMALPGCRSAPFNFGYPRPARMVDCAVEWLFFAVQDAMDAAERAEDAAKARAELDPERVIALALSYTMAQDFSRRPSFYWCPDTRTMFIVDFGRDERSRSDDEYRSVPLAMLGASPAPR